MTVKVDPRVTPKGIRQYLRGLKVSDVEKAALETWRYFAQRTSKPKSVRLSS